MNKYSVTLTLQSHALALQSPPNFTLSITGLQFNMVNMKFDNNIGTCVAVFDYVDIIVLQNDLLTFQIVDVNGSYTQNIDMMTIVATVSPFQIGNYIFSTSISLYPGYYSVTSTYDIKFILSAFAATIQNPTFYIYLKDAAGNSYSTFNHTYNVQQYDLQINGLSYGAALIRNISQQLFTQLTFTTSFGTAPGISFDTPLQPMTISSAHQQTDRVIVPSVNSKQIDLNTQIFSVRQPANLSYQSFNAGGNDGTQFQYSLLIKNLTFSSTKLAVVVPIIPVVITNQDVSLDQYLGINEQSLIYEIDQGNMSPGTRQAARKLIYEQELMKGYQKKEQEEQNQTRILAGNPFTSVAAEEYIGFADGFVAENGAIIASETAIAETGSLLGGATAAEATLATATAATGGGIAIAAGVVLAEVAAVVAIEEYIYGEDREKEHLKELQETKQMNEMTQEQKTDLLARINQEKELKRQSIIAEAKILQLQKQEEQQYEQINTSIIGDNNSNGWFEEQKHYQQVDSGQIMDKYNDSLLQTQFYEKYARLQENKEIFSGRNMSKREQIHAPLYSEANDINIGSRNNKNKRRKLYNIDQL